MHFPPRTLPAEVPHDEQDLRLPDCEVVEGPEVRGVELLLVDLPDVVVLEGAAVEVGQGGVKGVAHDQDSLEAKWKG